MQLHQQ